MTRLTRASVLTALVVLGTTACFDNSVAPGSGGSSSVGSPTSTSSSSLQASASGQLLSYMQPRLANNGGSAPQYSTGDIAYATTSGAALALGASSASSTAPSYASTTLQEVGVDEADWLKTDGKMIYSLAPDAATSTYSPRFVLAAAQRRTDGSLQPVSSQDYADATSAVQTWPTGILVSDDATRVAVTGYVWSPWVLADPAPGTTVAAASIYNGGAQVAIDVFATATGAAPQRRNRIQIEGSLIDSRVIGNTLYVVTSWSPYVVFPAGQTTEQRQASIAKLTAEALLPKIQITGSNTAAVNARQPLLADTDCYLQTANASQSTVLTTITAFNLASDTLERASRCFIGGAEAIYMSTDSVYVASTRYTYTSGEAGVIYPVQMTTDVHKFALVGLAIAYRGSGEVEGHLGWSSTQKSYRMSEYNNDLRVVSFTGTTGWVTIQAGSSSVPTTTPSPARLTILRENGGGTALDKVSTLPNANRPDALGKPGEQIYGVRFVGPRGYVVTFRRTDPLYVLDLADPAEPKIAGQLETAGYSDYLFPLPNNLLLGVGHDAAPARIKLSLFDVADIAQPTELATRYVGSNAGTSALDSSPHGINLLTQGNVTRIALPVDVWNESLRGLARFEVDSGARTLTDKTLVPAATACLGSNRYSFACWVGNERSVQIESDLYYLTGGELVTVAP
jgi:hypothetical protein